MNELTLHIGTEKTGTSSLQLFLHKNREELARQGYLYPASIGTKNHYAMVVCCHDGIRNDDLYLRLGIHRDDELQAFKRETLGKLKSEIDSSGLRHLIVSSEHFHSRLRTEPDRQELKRVFENLGFDRISVVVYLREQVSLANSLYSTAILCGSVQPQIARPEDLYIRNLCDHRQTIESWGSVFGPENLTIKLHDPDGQGRFCTVTDFLKLIPDLDPQRFVQTKEDNVSISALGVEIVRRINEAVPLWKDGRMNPLRKGFTPYFQEQYRGPKYAMPESLVQLYVKSFAESNEWVRQNYFPEREQLFVRKEAMDSPLEMSESELTAEVVRVRELLETSHSERLRKTTLKTKRHQIKAWFSGLIGSDSPPPKPTRES